FCIITLKPFCSSRRAVFLPTQKHGLFFSPALFLCCNTLFTAFLLVKIIWSRTWLRSVFRYSIFIKSASMSRNPACSNSALWFGSSFFVDNMRGVLCFIHGTEFGNVFIGPENYKYVIGQDYSVLVYSSH